MKKGKAITLLSIISFLLIALLVATFLRFSVGVKDYNGILGSVSLDYDMAGGSSFTYTLDKGKDANVDEVINLIEARLEKLGYSNFSVKASKLNDSGVVDSDIIVTAKNSESLASDIATAFKYGTLEMYVGTEQNNVEKVYEGKDIFDSVAYHGATSGQDGYYLTIKFTKKAFDSLSEKPFVVLKLAGETLFSQKVTTSQMVNREYSFGYGSEAGAKQIYLQLSTGGLDYEYKLESVEAVPAIYGENAPLIAVIIVSTLLLAVVVAFSIMFKGFGLVSLYTLLTFILAEVGLLVAIPNIDVSMVGVVGIIVALLIATDGLILTFNRIKEEFISGKTVKAAVNTGYRRAFKPILNTHIVALIISLLALFLVGGVIKNFAITLSVGIVVSFICTALLSRLMSLVFIPLIKKPEVFFNFKRKGE